VEVFFTRDGSPSACHPVHGESYHSRSGARTQAERLYLSLGAVHLDPRPRVFELGFGLGVNFSITLHSARSRGAFLDYLALEPEPVSLKTLANTLGLIDPGLFATLKPHWGGDLLIKTDVFRLRVLVSRVQRWRPSGVRFRTVYFDPFSPRTNPDVWKPGVYAKMYRILEPGGVLVTYSVAGHVRKGLEAAGFAVEMVPGWGGKRSWLRARRPTE